MSMLVPSAAAFAQGEIAGVVKDGTGAVLPGVTVEASSPALIEKVRTFVTDGAGLFKIVDLRPGVYAITFSLPGFATVKREGIELPASFTATVNAEMRVGPVEETVTVSGQSPLVDVQSVASTTVLSNTLMDAIPGVRLPQSFVPYLPGVSGVALGAVGRDTRSLAIHGGRTGEANVEIAGFPTRHIGGNGGAADAYYVNQATIEELSVQLGGFSAEQQMSGIVTNVIPKEGSNTFSGFLYASYSSESLQANNLTDDLKARGLTAVSALKTLSDVNPAFGGRLLRDKLWFYSAFRHAENIQYIAGLYYNKTPLAWVYTPDLSRPAFVKVLDNDANTRLTWQVTPRNKVSVYFGIQPHYVFQRNYSATVAPEATSYTPYLPNSFTQLIWKSPFNSRFLLEAGMSRQVFDYDTRRQTDPPVSPATLAATELSTGMMFRAVWPVGEAYGHHPIHTYISRASASYVTGSHALKVGFGLVRGSSEYSGVQTNGDIGVTLFKGVPRSLTLTAHPLDSVTNVDADLGLFAQDRWAIKRLTLDLGVRYDYFNASVPAQHLAAGRFVPARDYAPVSDVPKWKDVSPRVGASYDLFGNGKTALKATLGRYAAGAGAYLAAAANPVNRSVTSATRTWADAKGDYVPNCDFTDPATNGECGPLSDLNFGKINPNATRYDDALMHGSGKRGYNWEVSAALQHELLPGVSINAAYFRRQYGNFTVTQNLAVTAANFNPYCITAPADPRLPGGGANEICGLYDVAPARFGKVQNLVTLASNFGKQEDVYDGIDLTTSMRLHGTTLSGGLNTGRERTNNCFEVNEPELLFAGTGPGVTAPRTSAFCDIRPPFQSQVKFLAVYPLPWWGLQTSAVFQSVPGPQITANYVATNQQISPSLGRDLAAGANGTVLLDLIAPGTLYGDRLHQLDFRLTKLFTVARAHIQTNLDFFNVLNTHAIQTQNNRFGSAWQQPTQVQGARYVQFAGQVTF
jgi:hypothetical protein